MKRNLVISTKVTPEEKAEFTMIAQKNGISTSEWVYSILSMNKNGYEKKDYFKENFHATNKYT